jgi:hypothetical protein
MMGMAWSLLTASLLLAPAQADEIPACGVELRVRAKAAVMEVEHQHFDSWRAFEIELVNSSDRPVTLVAPGDGSGVAWRTPVLQWSISSDMGYQAPQTVRCGNINPLRPDEVFTLAPGERRTLGQWVPPIYGVTPATYTLRLSYINDPTLKWQGVELGPHDPATMQRVRESTPCRAVGNEVKVTVVSKQPRSVAFQ